MNKVERIFAHWWCPALILCVLGFALYSQSFTHEWAYDDYPVIVDNTDIRSFSNFMENSFVGRPLRELTFLLDYSLFELDPAGYHFQNIFWHVVSASLICVFSRLLGMSGGAAFIVGTIFLLHPLHVEVVASTSHRKDSLVLVFSLLAMISAVNGYRAAKKRWHWFLAFAIFGAIAATGKQTAIALLPLLLAYEYAFVLRQSRLILKHPAMLWLMVASIGTAWCYYVFVRGGQEWFLTMVPKALSKVNYYGDEALYVYVLMVLKSFLFMFSKLIWPTDLALEYTYAIPASYIDPWVLGSLVLLVVSGIAIYRAYHYNRLAFFGWCWMLFFWLPTSNLWPLSYFAADRYLYAPSFGLILVCGAYLKHLPVSRLMLGGGVVAGVFAFLAWGQIGVWKSPETLWTQAVKVSPQSQYSLNNLGNVYLLKKDLGRAREYYQRALNINANNPTALYNLGLVEERSGNLPRAIEAYRRFVNIAPPQYRVQAESIRAYLSGSFGIRFERKAGAR